jgi:RNA polymerase sigma-70 factor (ECF subfamily)
MVTLSFGSITRIQVMAASTDPSSADPIEPLDDLLKRYWNRAYRFSNLITRNDQESADIAQEALLKAYRKADLFDPTRGPFESWLWQIVLNVARDAGRAASRRRSLIERLGHEHASRGGADAELLAIRRLSDQELVAVVRRLPKRSRTLIALRFGAELSFAEIGFQLGLSEAAAVMATRRALNVLRNLIEQEVTR